MRTYILTKKEHEIIKRFLHEGIKMEGFTMLKHRIEKYRDTISYDSSIMYDFLRAIQIKKEREQMKQNP